MQKLISYFLLATLALWQIPFTTPAKAHEVNLITNPSVEESFGDGSPSNWGEGYNWGDADISYSYENSGHTGNKSLKVEVTRHVFGDAKWYFWPVDVKANTTYEFNNYYKSSVPSQSVVEVQDTAGNYSYHFLGENPASNNWVKAAYTFTTPTNTKKMTLFQAIGEIGWLSVDDFFLGEQHHEPDTGNVVPNQSLEELIGNNPTDWFNNTWGSNAPDFEVVNDAQSGNRSVKVTMQNYQDGDAKWYFAPQAVIGGKTYDVSDYYKSNVPTRVVIWVTNASGSNNYLELRSAPASPNSWTRYHDTVTVPADAVQATVFHLIDQNGYLITDNYSFREGTINGFNRPLISLTFDDGWEWNHRTALPLMQQYGMVSSQFYATTYINENDPEGLSQIRKFQNAGHEIGSHSVTHPDLTTLSPAELDYELRESKALLERNFGPIKNFATPFGAFNDTVINGIDNYYSAHRGVNAGFNSKDNFDGYRLKVQNITTDVTRQDVENWIQTAKEQKVWLILVYHRIDDQDISFYDTTPAQFESHLQEIAENDVQVVTVQQALDELRPQL